MYKSKLKSRLFAIVSLNVFDAIATLSWIENGLAEEANPLMATIIEYSPLCFLFTKISIASLVCLCLWRTRKDKCAIAASKFIFAAYSLLAGYHMLGFYKLLELSY